MGLPAGVAQQGGDPPRTDNAGEVQARHRTFLGRREDGEWDKSALTRDLRMAPGAMQGHGVRGAPRCRRAVPSSADPRRLRARKATG